MRVLTGSLISMAFVSAAYGMPEGRFKSGCTVEQGASYVIEMTLAEEDGMYGAIAYLDATCKTPAILQTMKISAGNDSPSTEVEGASNLDLTINQYLITPVDSRVVSYLNSQKLCGLSNWALNVANDVTGKDCQGHTVNAGDVVYDIYYNQGNSLWLGDSSGENDGSTEEKRPNTLDKDNTFTKVEE
jgi:hypothetical protein